MRQLSNKLQSIMVEHTCGGLKYAYTDYLLIHWYSECDPIRVPPWRQTNTKPHESLRSDHPWTCDLHNHTLHTHNQINAVHTVQLHVPLHCAWSLHMHASCQYVPCLPGRPCTTFSDGASLSSSCLGDCNGSAVSSSGVLQSVVSLSSVGLLFCPFSTCSGNGRLLWAVGWERTTIIQGWSYACHVMLP